MVGASDNSKGGKLWETKYSTLLLRELSCKKLIRPTSIASLALQLWIYLAMENIW